MSRRMRWAALGAGLSIALIAGGFVMLRGGSTPVSVDSAVERFRDRTVTVATVDEGTASDPRKTAPEAAVIARAAAPVAADGTKEQVRPLPAEGVYVYATTGGDEVDVLGGSRHEYPPETTITIRHTDCGVVAHWTALEERWDEREFCFAPEGDTLERMTSFHEFFGHADERTLHCTGFSYPAGLQPGSSWSNTCASDVTRAATTLTAVGWENIDVGGRSVRTMHVHAKTVVHGDQEGTSERDAWGSADFGFVVRERVTLTSDSNQPVFGRTRYHEAYEIRLKSLEPRR